MKIGFVGLGKMGKNLVLNLMDHRHEVIVFNRTYEKALEMKSHGALPVKTLKELAENTGKPGSRVIWLMITAGTATQEIINELIPFLSKGDTVIDGGNSHYKDSVSNAQKLEAKGIEFLDIGTSGGLTGARNGACLMIGGKKETFRKLEPLFKDISVPEGYAYCGKSGSGHFVKMVHNGIEYGMLAAIGEGFEIIHEYDPAMDQKAIARVWNHGSVIRGWLMELMEEAFRKDPSLKEFSHVMGHSGEGKWTVDTALELGVPAPVITLSLLSRFRSFQQAPYGGKVVSALRYGFGGHTNTKTGPK
ncbi:MAG: decarboxylating 6-phosphogluconate dehydrogenase [Candidatus Diapherotrites archaeon]|nr:decarboxylating 6-phosphogluconate dehydrogenase [Candidatus Diapherotrites archaeon]